MKRMTRMMIEKEVREGIISKKNYNLKIKSRETET